MINSAMSGRQIIARSGEQDDRICAIVAPEPLRGRVARYAAMNEWTVTDDVEAACGSLVLIDLSQTQLPTETLASLSKTANEGRRGLVVGMVGTDVIDLDGGALDFSPDHLLAIPSEESLLHMQLDFLFAKAALHIAGQDGAGSSPAEPRRLHERIDILLNSASPDPVHAMLIGLRRLEAINGTYGTRIGDRALEVIARRVADLADGLPGNDIVVGRISGGEFVVAARLIEDREVWQAHGEAMLARIAEPMRIDGHRLRLTARIGLAVAKPQEQVVSFLDRLTAALSSARAQDTAQPRWADRQSDFSPEQGYRLEHDIVQAIERDEIKVLFQPQFDVMSGKLVGAEALARWHHGRLGPIGPEQLFALADKADFTRPLTRHIHQIALETAGLWPDHMQDVRLSLNVTAQDLAAPDFGTAELEQVAQSGFPAGRLTMEITESALVPDLRRASRLFSIFREAGIAIAVDDFGTGYSNLLYLKSLPLDYLKLDHVMIRDIGGDASDRIITRSVIALARALGLKVIAEGVESEGQLDVLRQEGCDLYQGFLRAGALTSDALVAMAATERDAAGE